MMIGCVVFGFCWSLLWKQTSKKQSLLEGYNDSLDISAQHSFRVLLALFCHVGSIYLILRHAGNLHAVGEHSKDIALNVGTGTTATETIVRARGAQPRMFCGFQCAWMAPEAYRKTVGKIEADLITTHTDSTVLPSRLDRYSS